MEYLSLKKAFFGFIAFRMTSRDVPIKDEITGASTGELLAMLGWKRRKRQAKTDAGTD